MNGELILFCICSTDFIGGYSYLTGLDGVCNPVRNYWAGRGLQPRPQRFIEMAAMPQRLGKGCKPVPAYFSAQFPILHSPFLIPHV